MIMKEYLDYKHIELSRVHDCAFCNREFYKGNPMIRIETNNRIIIEDFFSLIKSKFTKRSIFVCPECFTKMHEYLENLEASGWKVI